METLNRTLSSQTERLIKGLEHLLQTKEYILSSYTSTYGNEQGEKMYTDLYEKDMDSILLSLKVSIGDSMEVNMGLINDNLY